MPSPRLAPKVSRLLGLTMFGAVAGMLLLLAVVIFGTRPNGPGDTGGLDPIHGVITWIAFTVILGAIIYIHVNFARQLFGEAKGQRRGVETW